MCWLPCRKSIAVRRHNYATACKSASSSLPSLALLPCDCGTTLKIYHPQKTVFNDRFPSTENERQISCQHWGSTIIRSDRWILSALDNLTFGYSRLKKVSRFEKRLESSPEQSGFNTDTPGRVFSASGFADCRVRYSRHFLKRNERFRQNRQTDGLGGCCLAQERMGGKISQLCIWQ